MFQAFGFESANSKETAIALIMGDLCERNANVPLLRVHSQCLTSEALGSLRCDCAEQLEIALRAISKEGRGLI